MLMNTTFLEDSFSIKWQTRDISQSLFDGKRKSRKPFHDFLLGGAAGRRLVFSFESSGQGGSINQD